MNRRSPFFVLLTRCALPGWAVLVGSPALATPETASAPASQPRIVTFQPGVRIDWTHRQVEVDATVILREGLIELAACSPQIREHEAIIRIEARPLHVFHALGLIGLTPGHPVLYDEEADRRAPATGDPVAIDVRYQVAGQPRTVPLEHWLAPSRDGQPVDRLPWVFAGSVLLEDDSIAADYEGTVVAVVDFGSSLIALPELHTDRNEDLWLQPNTPAIPPVDTRCTLLLRAGEFMVSLDSSGRIRLQGRRMTLAEAADRLAERAELPRAAGIRLMIDPACPQADRLALTRLLESLGLDADAGRIEPVTASAPAHNPDALIGWLAWQLRPWLGIHPSAERGPSESRESP